MKIILKIKILIKILIIISCSSHPSLAERISLNKISDYINGLTTLQADFEQINSDGSIDRGKLYIRRPGRMRLEYTAPNNALVIAGAGSVAIFDDKSKNGPTLFPLKKTPLNLFDQDSSSPTIFSPGDYLKFVPLGSQNEYLEIENLVTAKTFSVEVQ